VRHLRLEVDGEAQGLLAERMPRADLFAALHPGIGPGEAESLDADARSEDDPDLLSFRSGFWGLAGFEPVAGVRTARLGLRATLRDGGDEVASLGDVELRPGLDAPELAATTPWLNGPHVVICMATYNPPPELLARQIESIRAQTHRNWTCVIADDRSNAAGRRAIEAVIAGDERFVLVPGTQRLGFYGNFERALGLAPGDADFVAMADQDDRWEPDKLETLLDAIGETNLVYSDARIVDPAGAVISGTYWSRRRNNYTNLASLLIANTVTGAASLFRRDLLELALPFPPRQGIPYHDHWLATVALAAGEIAYVDRPLYDYVQHRGAALGHSRANAESNPAGGILSRLRRVSRRRRSTFAAWRAIYFWDICRIALFASVLERRLGDGIAPRRRRTLRRLAASPDSPMAAVWLAVRSGRRLAGRSETLGAETALLRGLAWRHAVSLLTGRRRRPGRSRSFAAAPPPLSELGAGPQIEHAATRTLAEKLRPLALAVEEGAPERVNLLIPTIDLQHFFGGYIAKLNLARRLAERGLRVRVVAVDVSPPLPRSWRQTVEEFDGLAGVFDRVEIAFARRDGPLETSPGDRFVATTWWTAHLAAGALRTLERDGERFTYLIQEYEPFTFPMGSLAAAATQSYALPHHAVFSSELLREYFARHGLGVFAAGAAEGEERSISFQNAISRVKPPADTELAGRRTRRLLFYARPEAHAARNMFELGILALDHALSERLIGPDWELRGVGSVTRAERIRLASGAELELVPRRDQRGYAEMLRENDVGLALMYTPHPSLVPIEMAAAGMLTVTNSFENKTADAMRRISPNRVAAEPTIDAIAAALGDAAAASGDTAGRVAGSAVDWSREWNTSFDERRMEAIAGFLGVGG
jgi:glycosyltransferase involved in cell wall biosynthesis